MPSMVLVVLQFALIALLIWPWTAPVWSLPALAVFLFGAVMGVWTLAFNRPGNFNIRPDLKPDARLVLDGPYAYVRHPMYVSVLLIGAATVLLYLDWLKLLCCLQCYGSNRKWKKRHCGNAFPVIATMRQWSAAFSPRSWWAEQRMNGVAACNHSSSSL
jgi:hypothetical protein